MDIELRNKVNLFYESYDEMKKIFKKDNKFLRIAEALVYGRTYSEFDTDKFLEIRNYLSEKAFYISEELLAVMSLMIQHRDNGIKIIDNTIRVYKYLLSKGLDEVEKCFFASFILAKSHNGEDLTEKIKKLVSIKEKFNGQHYIEYANLALTHKSMDEIYEEYKEIIEYIDKASLKDPMDKDGLALSLILQSEPVETKVEKLLSLLCNYKSEFSIISPSGYKALGVSTCLIEDSESFCKELSSIYKILNERFAFKYFMSKETKVNISLGIILEKYIEEVNSDLIEIKFKDEFKAIGAIEELILYSFV